MKIKNKTIKLLLIILIMLFLLNIASFSISFAESESKKDKVDEVEAELDSTIKDRLNKLDLSNLEIFLESLSTDYPNSFNFNIKKLILEIIDGNIKQNPATFYALILDTFLGNITKIIPMLISIIIISILLGVLSNMSSGFLKKPTVDIVNYIGFSLIVSIVVLTVYTILTQVTKLISNMNNFFNVIFPILLTLMTALGGMVSVSTYSPLMLILSTIISKIIIGIVIPLFIVTVIFNVVQNVSDNVKLTKFSKFFKSLGEWILGIVFSIFITFLTIQGITGATMDGISFKSAKFAISSYVPILGGYLSDGFDLIMASMVLIKNSIGLSSVIILLTIIIMPLINVIVFMLGLKLTSAIVEPICDKKISNFLYSISKSFSLLIACIIGLAFMFFLIIMLVIYTCNFGVM